MEFSNGDCARLPSSSKREGQRRPHWEDLGAQNALSSLSHHLLLSQLLGFSLQTLKVICSTNPFLRSLSGSIRAASRDFGLGLDFLGICVCLL